MRLWRHILKRVKRSMPLVETCREFLNNHGIIDENIRIIQRQTKLASMHLKILLRKAKYLREEHLNEKSEYYGRINKQDKATVIKNIQNAEISRETFQKLGRDLKHLRSHQIDTVLVPQTDGSLRNLTQADEIFDAILNNNEQI